MRNFGFLFPFEARCDSACAATVPSIRCRPGGLTENTDSGHSGEENAKALLRDQQFILEAG